MINRQFSAVRLRDQVRASRALQFWNRGAPQNRQRWELCSATSPTANFAGEPLSHIGAWQEGAILSARRAINMIDKHRHTQHV